LEKAIREPREGTGVAGGMLLFAVLLCVLTLASLRFTEPIESVLRALLGAPVDPTGPNEVRDARLLTELLGAAALGCTTTGAVLYLHAARRRARPLAIALVLLLHPLDVYGWKSRMVWLRTAPLSEEQYREDRISEAVQTAQAPTTHSLAAAVKGAGSCFLLLLLAAATGRELGLGRRGADA
jgi:hypothetical protein